MREAMQSREGERGKFCGTVERFGTKTAYRGPAIPTVLIVDVRDASGALMTDHLWMTVGKQIAALSLVAGDTVEFEARITSYEKGYFGYRDDVYKPAETDYRLSFPTKVKKANGKDE
jgi:phage tail sheath gpL-like